MFSECRVPYCGNLLYIDLSMALVLQIDTISGKWIACVAIYIHFYYVPGRIKSKWLRSIQ